MKNWLLVPFFFLSMSTVFAQGKITGTVQDENGSLPGANIVIEGTSNGTSSNFDGGFSITSLTATGKIVVSFLGYKTTEINFTVENGKTVDLGTIVLQNDGNVLGEVVITSTVVDIAKDRKTPVASSTIKASEIKEKLGSQEFPEILANTPSVYVSKAGGGFGDSKISIRGFDQRNVAVMINGVPINDMENGAVFWSNWAGLSDVTSFMQVQRGLGSSKLAISSVGGTINVITRTSDIKQGGSVSATMGNDSYIKTLASYSTGKMKNGLSTSVLFSNTTGDGYVDGTSFKGQNYFVGVGYEFNDKHNIQFTFTGAPQTHNQRSAAPTISQYIKYGRGGVPDIRFNSDWGLLNGEEYSFRTNYYHKPVASLNYEFKINDKTKLSSVFYGSWGRGGGSNGAGAMRGKRYFSDDLRYPGGVINVDLIQAWNSGQTVTIPGFAGGSTRAQINGNYTNSASTSNNLTNGISKISSINSHNWYGGVLNLNRKLTDKLTLDFGLDARTYKGIHYQNINDLIGATNYSDNFNVNNVNGANVVVPRILTTTYNAEPNGNPFYNPNQEKINYNNDGDVTWYGAFTQLEYSTEKLTAFVQGAISQQGFKRIDYFKYKTTDPLSSTDSEKILGGNVKGGVNYNINEHHNIFANAGYYSKQPFFNSVYPNNASKLNENLTNEKIMAFELGYGFRSSKFLANFNVYRTTWKDRFIRISTNIDDDGLPGTPTVPGSAFLQGVEQIHMGAELDFTYKVLPKLAINGMLSIGDWKYGSDVTANYQDDNNVVITNPSGEVFTETLYIDNLKVGDASAQTTASIGLNYEVLKNFKVDANYRHVDKLYAAIDPVNFKNKTEAAKGSLELPDYGLMDAGVSLKINRVKDSKDFFSLRLNVNNVLDKVFIAESRTNIIKNRGDFATDALFNNYNNTQLYNGIDKTNQVYFGFGRTWNFTLSYNF